MASSEQTMAVATTSAATSNSTEQDQDYQTTDIDNVIRNDNNRAKHSDFITPSTIDYEAALPREYYDKKIKIDIKTAKQLSGKQYLLIIPITRFFQNVRNMYILINILNGRSIISLRLIEYFVVNYVLENNTYFDAQKYMADPGFIVTHMIESSHTMEENGEGVTPAVTNEATTARASVSRDVAAASPSNFDNYFLVHDNYKSQLKEYNKKNFDPFCRWNRIRVYFDTKKYFYTTVAQLNFFKWAIENHVLDYILDSLDTIEASMNEYEKAIKMEKKVRKVNLMRQMNEASDETEQGNDESNTVDGGNSSEQQLMTESDEAKDEKAEPVSVPFTGPVSVPFTEPVSVRDPSVAALSTSPPQVNLLNGDGPVRRTKKRDLAAVGHPDKKSKLKHRKKKEFTKTNRSIIKYDCVKIINFD
jgi:hypothetical protein